MTGMIGDSSQRKRCDGACPCNSPEGTRTRKRGVKQIEKRQVQGEVLAETTEDLNDVWYGVDPHIYECERCIFCGVNVYDQMCYGDTPCTPREPFAFTSETGDPPVQWETRAIDEI